MIAEIQLKLRAESKYETRNHAWQTAAVAAAMHFSLALYEHALAMYRQTHDTVPGSERTSRLRKKRRARVLAWYMAWINGRESE